MKNVSLSQAASLGWGMAYIAEQIAHLLCTRCSGTNSSFIAIFIEEESKRWKMGNQEIGCPAAIGGKIELTQGRSQCPDWPQKLAPPLCSGA